MANGTLSVQVPADDGAIQRAIEQLDAQMDAWLAAMSRVEQALAGAAPRPPQELADDAEAAVEESQTPAPATAESTSPTIRREPDEPISEPAPASPAPESIQAASSPGSQGPDRKTQKSPPPKCEKVAAPNAPDSPSPAPKADSKDVTRKADEDEALLATLDEETAKAIRVMRRLCVNSKSVKELLAEYRTKKQGKPTEGSARKSWFRRGK